MMRRLTAILATALLASSLFTAAAEARGGGGHMGGFGGGAHFGGLGAGAHVGGLGGDTRIGGLGGGTNVAGGMTGHVGVDGHTSAFRPGLHRRAFGRFGIEEGESLECSDWYQLHPTEPLPLSCS